MNLYSALRNEYMKLDAIKEKTASVHIAMKNLVAQGCFQIKIPVITTKREIENGEQLFVDYTGGKKNTYLVSMKKFAQLVSEGLILQSQVSPCLNSTGGLCRCNLFFIIPKSQVSLYRSTHIRPTQ